MPEPILFQHYEVLTRGDGAPWELGRGAMGITYKALDSNLRVPVALKVIHPHQLHSEVAAQRFVREARAAARLRHPNIASVFHLGRDRDTWFYAMEFIDGETAESLVKRGGPLSESVALQFTAQIARALTAAENHDLVHRDIKPANLMIVRDGHDWIVKLIDFGLARSFTGESDEDLATVTHGGFLGTPYYASPEQLQQQELDIRSDIYSLGITLWYLLTGKVPFSGPMMSVMNQHLQRTPPLEQLQGVAGKETIKLIARMLEKDPANRPQTAADLRRDLEHCLAHSATVSTVQMPEISKASPSTAPTTPEQELAQTTTMETAPAATEPDEQAAAAESRFELVENLESLPFGAFARGKDRQSGAPLRVLRLDRQFGADPATVASLKELIAHARQISSESVLKVIGSEQADGEFRLAVEWINACSWLELLRLRGEIPPEEAWPLLQQAAEGCDAILAAGIQTPEVSLPSLSCVFSVDAVERVHLLQSPITQWPEVRVKVSPLGALRDLTLAVTWSGERTVLPTQEDPQPHGLSEVVRAFARVIYELLGGRLQPGVQAGPPLPALSETANELLKTILTTPAEFPTLAGMVNALREAHAAGSRAKLSPAPAAPVEESVPADPPPAVADPKEDSVTIAGGEISTPTEVEGLPVDAEAKELNDEVPEDAVANKTEAEPVIADESEVADAESAIESDAPSVVELYAHSETPIATPEPIESPVELAVAPSCPSEQPTIVPGESAQRRNRFAAIAGAGMIAVSGLTVLWWNFPQDKSKGTAQPTPQSVSVTTPAPVAVTTNTAVTPVPVTPEPPTPKTSLDLIAEARSERLAFNWEKAARILFTIPQEHASAAKFELELMFRDLRRYTTPFAGLPVSLKLNEQAAIIDEAEMAAELDVREAMLFLGHFYTETDWEKALEWLERAKARGLPKAATRIGQLLAKHGTTAADFERAWENFQYALELEDLDAQVAVAECYLHGTLNVQGATVATLKKDEQRAERMLREAIGRNSRPLEENGNPDKSLSEPSRAKILLGSLYNQMEMRPSAERPDWYTKAATASRKAEVVRMLEEAAQVETKAYGILGRAAQYGTLMPKSEKKAVEYFKKGAGDPMVAYSHAAFLIEKAAPAIPLEAQELMKEAAEKGIVPAQRFCRERGIAFKEPAK